MKTIKLFLIVAIAFCLLNCQNTESRIDNIGFTYGSALRIPYSTVNVDISRTHDNKNAVAFVHCEASSDEAKWAYSQIDTVIDVDIESFEKLAEATRSLENINLDKAYEDGLDGSTWKIEFGAKGKNISYSFWVPSLKTKERGLTEFVNLSKQILDIAKLNKKEILD